MSLGAAVRVAGPLSIVLDARVHPEIETVVGGDRYALGLFGIGGGACATAVPFRPLALEGCAKVWVGAIHAVVFEAMPTAPGERLWAAAGLSAGASVELIGPVALEAHVEGVIPIVRHDFTVEGTGTRIFRQNALLPGATVGLRVGFR